MATKRRNVILKFRTFWSKLNDEERLSLWLLFTAMRSCDDKKVSFGEEEKKLITTRLRAAFFGEKFISSPEMFDGKPYKVIIGCGAFARPFKLTEEEILSARKLLSTLPSHFRAHVKTAVDTLYTLGLSDSISDL